MNAHPLVFGTLLTLLLALPVAAQMPDGDFVRLKSGHVVEGPVRVEGTMAESARFVTADGRTYGWREIVRVRSGGQMLVNVGQLEDDDVRERLLVRIHEGRLHLFAPYGTAAVGARPTHFSRGDGLVLPLEREHLRPVLADAPESVALLDRSRRYRQAANVMLVTGLAAGSLAIYRMGRDWSKYGSNRWGVDRDTERPTGLIVAGVGLTALAVITRSLAASRQHRAVERYLDGP